MPIHDRSHLTHYMEEAQELSDHIAIMDHGRVIAHGKHEELVLYHDPALTMRPKIVAGVVQQLLGACWAVGSRPWSPPSNSPRAARHRPSSARLPRQF